MIENKLKILYLMRLLQKETDASHPLNAEQLCAEMNKQYGIPYERKTIYKDIELLKTYGVRIGQIKGRTFGYFVEERDFSLPELKLLVDAVQSSKFITKEKSEELIHKLEGLTSYENAKQLQRQVYIFNRIKAGNDAIYSNVDAIHEAIQNNCQISFKYCEWTVKKELVRKKGGVDYIVSPWALTWDDENYYLVGYEDKIKHYRVDKMQEIMILEEPRLGKEQFVDFDLAAFAKKTFGMYGGEDQDLVLECDNTLAGVIIDRFGMDVLMIPHGKVVVSVSPQFFGWLAGLGGKVRICSPKKTREEYTSYLEGILGGS